LKKSGLAENNKRGLWSLTELVETTPSSELPLIPKRVRGATIVDVPVSPPDQGPDWQDVTLQKIARIQPEAFERLCQRILRDSGFIRVEVTGRSGDGGIDGTGVLRVKLVSFPVVFQCKRWKGSVGPSVVRDFRGAMVGRAEKGLITTSTFTADAKREAIRPGAPTIDLVDGEALCLLLKELQLGLKVRQGDKVELDEGFLNSI
jgi:restriction system protein